MDSELGSVVALSLCHLLVVPSGQGQLSRLQFPLLNLESNITYLKKPFKDPEITYINSLAHRMCSVKHNMTLQCFQVQDYVFAGC